MLAPGIEDAQMDQPCIDNPPPHTHTHTFIFFLLQRGAEFSAPEMEDAPGTTLIEVVLALCAWTLARAGRGGAVAAPALAAVARNACPFLTAGMR